MKACAVRHAPFCRLLPPRRVRPPGRTCIVCQSGRVRDAAPYGKYVGAIPCGRPESDGPGQDRRAHDPITLCRGRCPHRPGDFGTKSRRPGGKMAANPFGLRRADEGIGPYVSYRGISENECRGRPMCRPGRAPGVAPTACRCKNSSNFFEKVLDKLRTM